MSGRYTSFDCVGWEVSQNSQGSVGEVRIRTPVIVELNVLQIREASFDDLVRRHHDRSASSMCGVSLTSIDIRRQAIVVFIVGDVLAVFADMHSEYAKGKAGNPHTTGFDDQFFSELPLIVRFGHSCSLP